MHLPNKFPYVSVNYNRHFKRKYIILLGYWIKSHVSENVSEHCFIYLIFITYKNYKYNNDHKTYNR